VTSIHILPADDPASVESLLARRRATFKTGKKVDLRDGAWEGVLVVEGRPTGDGREFTRGSLTWEEPPLSLTYRHQGDEGYVTVGRIDRIWRRGDEVWGEGVFDLRSPQAAEVTRQVAQGFIKGVSVQVDDDRLETPTSLPGGPAEVAAKRVYGQARVRGAAVCEIPAFVEAQVWLKHLGRGNLAASAGGVVDLLDLLRKMPDDVRLLVGPGEDLATAKHRYLRARGLTDEQIREGLVASVHCPNGCLIVGDPMTDDEFRELLVRQVHPPASVAAGGGPGGSGSPQSRPPSAGTPPAVVAAAVEGRPLVADDLTALTGSGGPQRAGGFALRHFAGEWWLCRAVGGSWTNTGYAASGGRWWRWTKDRLVETHLPAPYPGRRRGYGLVAAAPAPGVAPKTRTRATCAGGCSMKAFPVSTMLATPYGPMCRACAGLVADAGHPTTRCRSCTDEACCVHRPGLAASAAVDTVVRENVESPSRTPRDAGTGAPTRAKQRSRPAASGYQRALSPSPAPWAGRTTALVDQRADGARPTRRRARRP